MAEFDKEVEIIKSSQYKNVDEAKIQGFEGKITWEPKNWFKIVASCLWQSTRTKTSPSKKIDNDKENNNTKHPKRAVLEYNNDNKGTIWWSGRETGSIRVYNLFGKEGIEPQKVKITVEEI